MKKLEVRPSALANRLICARSEVNCICRRPQTVVVCSLCQFSTHGRTLRPCPAHPNVFYLMDFQYCPKCKQSYRFLNEVSPSDNRFGMNTSRICTK